MLFIKTIVHRKPVNKHFIYLKCILILGCHFFKVGPKYHLFQYHCYLVFKATLIENVISNCISIRMTRRRYTVPPACATTRWWSCCWSTRQTPTPPQQQDTLHCTSLPVRDTHKLPASYWTWNAQLTKMTKVQCCPKPRSPAYCITIIELSLETVMLFDWCNAERLHSPSCSSQIREGGCSSAAFRERSQPNAAGKVWISCTHACVYMYL